MQIFRKHIERIREPISFISVVNDFDEAEHNLLSSPVRSNPAHEWIIIDNIENKASDHICQLYCDATASAKNDLVFFFHQDVYLPNSWERKMYSSLYELENIDPRWGVLGAVGVVPYEVSGRAPRGHWADLWSWKYKKCIGPFPAVVQSLDELWLGFRKSRGLSFDENMPGWHCYGVDICLAARALGLNNYAIKALAWHKYRDRNGNRLRKPAASDKIVNQSTVEFHEAVKLSKSYVREKWASYIPFRSTSMEWRD
jgi:hypothetical protein